jgi:cyclase
MLAKRIIPCLDVMNGRVVKGIGFKELSDAGDPTELAHYYYKQGADEIVFLDITASYENRDILIDIIEKTSDSIFVPFTVGGGIQSIEDIRRILCSGADKIAINTAAVKDPNLIQRSANMFGSQCIVSSIDIKRVYVTDESEAPGKIVKETPQGKCWWNIHILGGRKQIDVDAFKWAERMVKLGAGEILISSLDFDGTKKGYDLVFLKEISERVSVPIIASSGAGTPEHIYEALTLGKSDAALAASIFHYNIYTIKELKKYLIENGVLIRI